MPSDKKKLLWDFIMSIVFIIAIFLNSFRYIYILIINRIAFSLESVEETRRLELVIDIFILLDICFTFLTAGVNDTKIQDQFK